MQTHNPNRRKLLRAGLAFASMPGTVLLSAGCGSDQLRTSNTDDDPSGKENDSGKEDHVNRDQTGSDATAASTESTNPMQIQYLEIVTKDVDSVCAMYAQLHGVTFGEADAGLGGARTAALTNGGMLGVRAPMHEAEEPVVRPYLLVDDIESATAAAAKSGAEIAHPPMELPGHGTFAIFIQGGIHHGLWQV